MLIYAGIDEAGYGPLLGPLVVARSVFRVDGAAASTAPPLWTLLRSAVCRGVADKKRRIAVDDSKRVYNAGLGLGHLERGVLGFLHAAGERTDCLADLLALVAHDRASRKISLAWYEDAAGGPQLPLAAEPADLERCAGRLTRALQRSGVALLETNAAVVFEDRFKHILGGCRSNAACSWRFVAGHLRAIWERYGEQQPLVVVDRQGGRQNYLDLLAALFPWTQLRLLRATPRESSYQICDPPRAMTLSVVVESEGQHLPAALASMTAKYLRELLMVRFQAYWRLQAPEVRPTAGYTADGRRFLREIEPTLARLGVAAGLLARRR
jgi:hypothetical protein